MEFNFNVQALLQNFTSNVLSNGVCVLKGDELRIRQVDRKISTATNQLTQVIDRLGEASAKVSNFDFLLCRHKDFPQLLQLWQRHAPTITLAFLKPRAIKQLVL